MHHQNLDAIATGGGTLQILRDWAGGCLTWSRVAEQLKAGETELATQLELCATVLDRYTRTGRIGFTGPEYQLAKAGVGYMDDLAEIVDRYTACQAADWSEATVDAWLHRRTLVDHCSERAKATDGKP